ncbi:hypothetical protein ISN45_At03g043350 [Arabidopsis thaliana x Arabidopsis arenosa]|uniref:Uncharacterized protein n=1 Tax=Arabidopsis thaliana x Arabidopsis arenosa TaxID=1240361 RepID=A0A8T2EXA0_9BRAS|nr:hypothetical protein ISN45_At03g043350 [Arabidopsis thaliana x Arabidopsis arenosa]
MHLERKTKKRNKKLREKWERGVNGDFSLVGNGTPLRKTIPNVFRSL